jgi:hypothetical protein
MAVEPMVDGIIALLRVNLIANTVLINDAHIGDTVIYVDNAFRFHKFDTILIMDNNAQQDDSGILTGAEFHTVDANFYDTNAITLKEPLEKDFLVSDNGRIQKTIKKAILYEKDVLYGDRQVVNFDFVAICVEPENLSREWLATRLIGGEFRMSIMVYVKSGGAGEDEEYAQRVCNAYADATAKVLMGNLHLDFSIDEVPLVRDASAGDTGVYIGCNVAHHWTPESMECHDAEVQDNFGAQQLLKIVWPGSSSSSSSSQSSPLSMSSASSSSLTSLSSLTISNTSSNSSQTETSETSQSSTSSESWSSQSISTTEATSQSSTSTSKSSVSSISSMNGGACWIEFGRPLLRGFKMKDKAMLRKKKVYVYDSRVENVEYGTTQKGSVLLKAARLTWFGKETEAYEFPQIGTGQQE